MGKDMGMTKEDHIAASLEKLLDQLTYSVERFGGKTAVTPTDLAVLRDALRLILRDAIRPIK